MPAYAAILALLFIALSVRTIRLRRRFATAVGDGGNETMLRAMRAHSNFAEYVPFTLLLLAFAELSATPSWILHALCMALAAGRCSHAFGVSRLPEDFRFRVFGMALTFTALGGAALVLLVKLR